MSAPWPKSYEGDQVRFAETRRYRFSYVYATVGSERP